MPDHRADFIYIEELEVTARIGVPDEERRKPQRLTISLSLWPKSQFDETEDDIVHTVNYASVARDVQDFTSRRRDKLLETLADAIARHLLDTYPLKSVRIEVRKFVLAETRFVAAVCHRDA